MGASYFFLLCSLALIAAVTMTGETTKAEERIKGGGVEDGIRGEATRDGWKQEITGQMEDKGEKLKLCVIPRWREEEDTERKR